MAREPQVKLTRPDQERTHLLVVPVIFQNMSISRGGYSSMELEALRCLCLIAA